MDDNLEELINAIQGSSFRNGQVSGVEIAAKKLREEAVECFKNGNDAQAITHRNMAQDLQGLALQMRKDYDAKYRPLSDEALAKLDELQAR